MKANWGEVAFIAMLFLVLVVILLKWSGQI
jgi:hypothetical protein